MKRLGNRIWVGVIAAFAVIVGACCSHKESPANNEDPANQESNEHQMTKRELKKRIEEIRARVEEREMSCVYGSPEIIEEYGWETDRLRHEADSLQNLLDNYDKK